MPFPSTQFDMPEGFKAEAVGERCWHVWRTDADPDGGIELVYHDVPVSDVAVEAVSDLLTRRVQARVRRHVPDSGRPGTPLRIGGYMGGQAKSAHCRRNASHALKCQGKFARGSACLSDTPCRAHNVE